MAWRILPDGCDPAVFARSSDERTLHILAPSTLEPPEPARRGDVDQHGGRPSVGENGNWNTPRERFGSIDSTGKGCKMERKKPFPIPFAAVSVNIKRGRDIGELEVLHSILSLIISRYIHLLAILLILIISVDIYNI